ncbi:hypothetical protein EMCRGX_G018466 [Ephydatia muelleri]
MEPFPTEVQLCKIKSFGQRACTVPTNRTPLREEQCIGGSDQPRQKKKRRVYYGQIKTFRCIANQGDDDDSIVKHKLATTAVREKPSTRLVPRE